MYCKDCRFWDTDKSDWTLRKLEDNQKVCLRIVGDTEKEPLGIAYTIGHYGEDSGLVTRADFGCVLFEAKK
jgi:hypothetical protein